MYELKISVTKVLGTCTAYPPHKPGDYFTIRDGSIRMPAGGHVCIWALGSLLPLIPAKERKIAEERTDDWMWRVHSAQCPDPDGRVVFKIERVDPADQELLGSTPSSRSVEMSADESAPQAAGSVHDLRVIVDEVRGKCTSGMRPGDYFLLRSGRLTIPAGRHFCLYALQAVLPFLAAKQRSQHQGDWLLDADHFVCPDPAGNVIMRVERIP